MEIFKIARKVKTQLTRFAISKDNVASIDVLPIKHRCFNDNLKT
jgi:hypothetical protein